MSRFVRIVFAVASAGKTIDVPEAPLGVREYDVEKLQKKCRRCKQAPI